MPDVTRLLERRRRDTEDLLVQLDKGEGNAAALLPQLHDDLELERLLLAEVIAPLIRGLGDARLRQVSHRLRSAREGLTGAVPASCLEEGFRQRISHLCEQLEVQHMNEEEMVFAPLRKLYSPAVLARAADEVERRLRGQAVVDASPPTPAPENDEVAAPPSEVAATL